MYLKAQPWNSYGESDEVGAISLFLTHNPIKEIYYGTSPNWGTREEFERNDIHDVDHYVTLRLENGWFRASWLMQGFDEGIALEITDDALPPMGDIQNVSVTESKPWTGLVRLEIENVTFVPHIPDEESSRNLWSVRLDLEEHRSVVVCLGIYREGVIEYHPTNLTVIFSKEIATSYRTPGSRYPAWGR
ncbi:hypothetical protein [Sphaerimonospora mesophila]|uniref:hypothetical protein n=1 Tax=Sphaerimonospora mesophila TaxID=37483 RepID=UPI000A78B30C